MRNPPCEPCQPSVALLTSGRYGVIDIEIAAKSAVTAVRSRRSTILRQAIGHGLGPAARANQSAMRLAGIFSDDVNHAVHCVSAPYGAAWSADHFDVINVLQRHV